MAAIPTSTVRQAEWPTISDAILMSPRLKLRPSTWIPGLTGGQPLDFAMPTNFNGQVPVSIVVDHLDLPIPARRWKVSIPGHPEITFESLREGNYPELTEEEKEARGRALDEADTVRTELDIRPLTTATIVRQIREGKLDSAE